MENKRVKKVRRLNVKALIILLLIIYIIVMFLCTLINRPITNIYINNTNLLTDNEIIEISGIKDYPPIFKVSVKKIEDKIKKLELVNDVKVKKTIGGKLIIDVDEAIPLFYNRNTDKVYLSNLKEVENNTKFLGIPTLVNYVPKDLLKNFGKAFKNIDVNIIRMINEIEYDPDISEGVVIDENRFKLRMNDGNLVYVDTINMERLNDYISINASIVAGVGDKKGTLYLDGFISNDNNLFVPFGEDKDNNKDKESDEKDNLEDTENIDIETGDMEDDGED